jgi:hypothetical protein
MYRRKELPTFSGSSFDPEEGGRKFPGTTGACFSYYSSSMPEDPSLDKTSYS